MKKRIYILLILLTVPFLAFGQAMEEDLLNQLNEANNDSLRANLNYSLSVVTADDNEKSINYAKKSFILAQKANVKNLMAKSGVYLAHFYIAQGDHTTAIRYLLQAFRAYEKSPQNEQRATVALEIGTFYQDLGSHEKALEYLNIAYKILEKKLNERTYLIELIGYSYISLKKYEVALDFYAKVLPIYEKNNNTEAQILTHRKIINIYKIIDRHSESLPHNLKIYQIYEKADDKLGMANAANNLGYTYRFLKDFPNAIIYFKKALEMAENLKQEEEKAVCYVNLAIVYQNKNEFTSAQKYFNLALNSRQKIGNQVKIAQTYHTMAEAFFVQKDLYEAFRYIQEALLWAEKSKDPYIRQDVYQTASVIYQQLDDYKNALNFYQNYLVVKDSLLVEQRVEQQKKDRKQFDLEKTEKELKLFLADEELKNLEKDLSIKQLQIETERSERELENLRKDKELQRGQLIQRELEKDRAMKALLLTEQSLAAARKDNEISGLQEAKQAQEIVLKQKEIEQKEKKEQILILENKEKLNSILIKDQEEERKYITGLLILAFLVMLLIIAGYLNQRKTNRKLAAKNIEIAEQRDLVQMKSVELQQQSEEIEAQRDTLIIKTQELDSAYNNITDSVRYASRIQAAMMVAKSVIYNAFPDAFVLYMPKDIISGDFYWYLEKKNKKYIAAVDCTGHGVPGALMSMLGSNMLNEITTLRNIEKPSEILDQLHLNISQALKQGTTDNRDGMDITLALIDFEQKNVQLAAAKNPIFYFLEGNLEVIKGDKMPVGGRSRQDEMYYTNHEISYAENKISFYLFSDGYQDQFGGEDNRKFMIKRMRELISDIYQKPMLEQEEILEKNIKKWMKSHNKQTDDILILGFQVA